MSVQSISCEICSFCIGHICSAEKVWGTHHDNYRSLETSGKAGCIFCASLWEDVTRSFTAPSTASWPLYRWNLHQNAKTRDTEEVIAVTFRPLHVVERDNSQSGTLPDRTFYFYESEALGNIPERSELGASTNSEETWKQIKKWIKVCVEGHLKCRLKTSGYPPVPTRLLDISHIDIDNPSEGKVYLVDTAESNIEAYYTTLSHSWGPNPSFVASTPENQHTMKVDGIKMSGQQLSNNFRDAILVSRRLGIKYMWMDSICIIQTKEDFGKEAPRMHLYYRNAFCNIAAAASKCPEQGLFRDRVVKGAQSSAVLAKFSPDQETRFFGRRSWLIVPSNLWESKLLLNPLYSRGWVFQERMLAPRILHFSHFQVFFECATISACEVLPDKLPRAIDYRAATDRHWRQRLKNTSLLKDHPLSGTEDLSVEDFWTTAVGTYTRCELTNGSDKIIALTGVSTLVSEALGEAYGDGLWELNLVEQLPWHVVDCRQANGTPSKRPEPLRAPSWSWASCDGIIQLHGRLARDREYRVRNFYGNDLKFDIQKQSDAIAVPSALTKSKNDANQQRGTESDSSKKANQMDLAVPVTSSIQVRAYIRRGQVRLNAKSGKWGLCVWDRSPEGPKLVDTSIEVFPDEIPSPAIWSCSIMVLAYDRVIERPVEEPGAFGGEIQWTAEELASENDGTDDGTGIDDQSDDPPDSVDSDQEPSNEFQEEKKWQEEGPENYKDSSIASEVEVPLPTFRGTGLIIQEVFPCRYYRRGAFVFTGLIEEDLAYLTIVGDDHAIREEAQNIYLH